MQTKQCNLCKKVQEIDCFHKSTTGRVGVRAVCKTCANKQKQNKRKQNKITNTSCEKEEKKLWGGYKLIWKILK